MAFASDPIRTCPLTPNFVRETTVFNDDTLDLEIEIRELKIAESIAEQSMEGLSALTGYSLESKQELDLARCLSDSLMAPFGIESAPPSEFGLESIKANLKKAWDSFIGLMDRIWKAIINWFRNQMLSVKTLKAAAEKLGKLMKDNKENLSPKTDTLPVAMAEYLLNDGKYIGLTEEGLKTTISGCKFIKLVNDKLVDDCKDFTKVLKEDLAKGTRGLTKKHVLDRATYAASRQMETLRGVCGTRTIVDWRVPNDDRMYSGVVAKDMPGEIAPIMGVSKDEEKRKREWPKFVLLKARSKPGFTAKSSRALVKGEVVDMCKLIVDLCDAVLDNKKVMSDSQKVVKEMMKNGMEFAKLTQVPYASGVYIAAVGATIKPLRTYSSETVGQYAQVANAAFRFTRASAANLGVAELKTFVAPVGLPTPA